MVTRLTELVGGLRELILLGVRSRFRMRGAYWRWRAETAFGSDPATRPRFGQRVRMVLDYGAWVYRMKRLRHGGDR